MTNQGKVYIASMNLRGELASLPLDCKRINVTSAQSKTYRLAFSPMKNRISNSILFFFRFRPEN